METKEIVEGMLRESTGRHFLDSGGAYGRHWERNKTRDFEKEKGTVVEFTTYSDGEGGHKLCIDVTHNIYHWMKGHLTYDERMDRILQKFAERRSMADVSWLGLHDEFIKFIQSFGIKLSGLYGDGEPFVANTYNEDNNLSQDLQYTYFTCDGTAYAIVSVHNGCDIRGGYTRPRAFQVGGDDDSDDTAIFEMNRASVGCKGRSVVQRSCKACKNWWVTPVGPLHDASQDRRYPVQTDFCLRCGSRDVVLCDPHVEYHSWEYEGYRAWSANHHGERLAFNALGTHGGLLDFGVKVSESDIYDPTETEPGVVVVFGDRAASCPECGAQLEA